MKRSRAERKKAAKAQHRKRKQRRKLAERKSLDVSRNDPVDSATDIVTEKPRADRAQRLLTRHGDNIAKEFLKHPGNLSDWLNFKHPYYRKELSQDWCAMTKTEKCRYIEFDRTRIIEARSKTEKIEYPFETNSDDHCETCPTAYKDIVPILQEFAKLCGKTTATLRIYDPYYCAGAVVQHLCALGFENVYNKCEDFYKVIKKKKTPAFDVLVTNPPYSEKHVKRLLQFCSKQSVPCLLLMPNHIQAKDFFPKAEYVMLKPKRRYVYWTPKGLRSKAKQQNHACAKGFRTSPFPTSWYCDTKFRAVDLKAIYSDNTSLTLQVCSSENGSSPTFPG